MGKLLSAQEVAQQLGVSVWTIFRLTRSGKLASVQIGRRRLFAEEDLDELIKIRRQASRIQSAGQLAEGQAED